MKKGQERSMLSGTPTSKGQRTPPKATPDVRELKGMLHRKGGKPLSVGEMNAIIRRRGAGRA